MIHSTSESITQWTLNVCWWIKADYFLPRPECGKQSEAVRFAEVWKTRYEKWSFMPQEWLSTTLFLLGVWFEVNILFKICLFSFFLKNFHEFVNFCSFGRCVRQIAFTTGPAPFLIRCPRALENRILRIL